MQRFDFSNNIKRHSSVSQQNYYMYVASWNYLFIRKLMNCKHSWLSNLN